MGQDNKDKFLTKRLAKKDYFERWHINLVDANKGHVMNVTAGILLQGEERNAFIQVSSTFFNLSRTFTYELGALSYEAGVLYVDGNIFSDKLMVLDLVEDNFSLKGRVEFGSGKSLTLNPGLKGLMGPFKYLPFMQSYHEVISLEHYIMGSMELNDQVIDWNEGKGYMEKDWGKRFPNVWLWMQCNHFKHHDCAIMVGVARMPVFFNYYTAFAIPVYYNDKLEIFANYAGGHIAKLYRYKGYIHLVVTQKDKVLEIKVFGEEDVPLVAAQMGHLIRDVYECLTSKVEIRITQGGRVIFEDTGECASLKMGGNTSKLK